MEGDAHATLKPHDSKPRKEFVTPTPALREGLQGFAKAFDTLDIAERRRLARAGGDQNERSVRSSRVSGEKTSLWLTTRVFQTTMMQFANAAEDLFGRNGAGRIGLHGGGDRDDLLA